MNELEQLVAALSPEAKEQLLAHLQRLAWRAQVRVALQDAPHLPAVLIGTGMELATHVPGSNRSG